MTEEHNEVSTKPGRISSRRIYSGRIISVDLDEVRFPNGATGELEMIRHSGASAIVPILNDGNENPDVLLIRQYRYAADGYVYEIPAGRLEPAEAPEQCARRELKEETGYSAAHVHPLTTIFTTPGFTDERIHIFMGQGLTPGRADQEPDEFLELHPIPLSRAVAMVRAGEIVDGKTVVGLLLAQLRYQSE